MSSWQNAVDLFVPHFFFNKSFHFKWDEARFYKCTNNRRMNDNVFGVRVFFSRCVCVCACVRIFSLFCSIQNCDPTTTHTCAPKEYIRSQRRQFYKMQWKYMKLKNYVWIWNDLYELHTLMVKCLFSMSLCDGKEIWTIHYIRTRSHLSKAPKCCLMMTN